ncbi:hypothetical protein RHMOL_Rhmol01G0037300 [Rhododendron molle]|uniref:Uncharacterized protein n=1 Tax=Rhododendron molle TaxID=49168 RepID=A0ACC0PYB3_RHOML|nr:hypothetical protein RHMOL_Rhmol01G0037300 [Rhododendron molle]
MVEEEKEHINDGIIADGDNGIPSRGEPSRWRLARHSSRKLGRGSYNWLYHSNCICALNSTGGCAYICSYVVKCRALAAYDIDMLDMSARYKTATGRACQQKDVLTIEHHYHIDIFNAAIEIQLAELNDRFNEGVRWRIKRLGRENDKHAPGFNVWGNGVRGEGLHWWYAVASWTWDAQDETCGIGRMAFDGCCPDCKLPGDDCPLIWGACNHAFHLHCILEWVTSQTPQAHCPMCRREWQFKGGDQTD